MKPRSSIHENDAASTAAITSLTLEKPTNEAIKPTLEERELECANVEPQSASENRNLAYTKPDLILCAIRQMMCLPGLVSNVCYCV